MATPGRPWQRLYFFPLPQKQGPFRLGNGPGETSGTRFIGEGDACVCWITSR